MDRSRCDTVSPVWNTPSICFPQARVYTRQERPARMTGEGVTCTMPRIPLSNIDGNVYERLMGHCPEILKAWFTLDATMRFSGALSPELKEEVRRSLAPGVGCVFCASLGDEATSHAD